MIVRLIEDCEVNGKQFSKGTEIAVSRRIAIELCNKELAVANEDIPCEDRQKKAAKKTKSKPKSEPVLNDKEDDEVKLSKDL